MVRFENRVYWLLAIIAYWLCALWLFYRVIPISFDGGGPVVTFYWGSHPPTPTLSEYHRNIDARLPFLLPYWAAASGITFLGCGFTNWLSRLWRPMRESVFVWASITTLLSSLLIFAISDLGTAVRVWRGPVVFGEFYSLVRCLRVLVPMSLFAGVLMGARNRAGASARR
jgi:hypothetical protein